MTFDQDVCGNPDAGLTREWLETNGIGGFASSTIPGANTRRYHGLLTAALRPPVDRYVLLSKLEETVFVNGAMYELSTNIYPGTLHPQGYRYLKQFRLDPFPIFTWQLGSLRIEKQVYMVQGENTTVIEYRIVGSGECTLEVRPLIAFRDYHSTTHANEGLDPQITKTDGEVSIQPYNGLPRLWLAHNAQWVSEEGAAWYRNFVYPRERERGLDYLEDLFQPLVMQFRLTGESGASVIASTESHQGADVATIRRNEMPVKPAVKDELISDLITAADQFIARRAGDLHTIIAGYHWFSDWGRDTMIALPGLTLATKRFDIARDILLAFSRVVDCGMLPNRFPDVGEEPEYNTCDASLWYFEAIRKFVEYTDNFDFVKSNLYETMKSIIDWHLKGTRYGIRCGPDGLISAGGPDTQLTWMDAKVGDKVMTPRNGKAVEIQALWYNALCCTESLARRFGDADRQMAIAALASKAAASFHAEFWNEEAGCLYDAIDGEHRDASIRPNQVIALSLGHTMVPKDRARSILAVVERELLTDFGLRTLSPKDPQYLGRCDGDQFARDSAYHQGTVWPWLLGPFITAYRRFTGDEKQASQWLEPFRAHLKVAGLGTISEIFDGDAPHEPRGCIAQAWSVGEILRVLTE